MSFTEQEHNIIKKRLSDPETRKQVEHCMHQLIRFSHQASNGHQPDEERIMQFGLNLGRAQELLGAPGGVDKWWRAFNKKDWSAREALARIYTKEFGLADPSYEFISRL